MAKYNREFLVPYLQSICALELAQNKLSKKDEELQYQVRLAQNGYSNPTPRMPEKKPLVNFMDCLFLIAAIALFVPLAILVWGILFSDCPGGFIIFVLIGGAIDVGLFSSPICNIKEGLEWNSRNEEQYYEGMKHYRRMNEENAKMRKAVPVLQLEMANCRSEIEKGKMTLKQVYSANIIPSRYRNIYVAIYLYDWFSTSQADELDAALNMFVLEEIKDRLDTIIRNQSEMILNQYMMLSNQQKSLEQQEAHGRMMRGKLDQMIATEQERNVYLEMIEGNTRATAYFAAADYIRKI